MLRMLHMSHALSKALSGALSLAGHTCWVMTMYPVDLQSQQQQASCNPRVVLLVIGHSPWGCCCSHECHLRLKCPAACLVTCLVTCLIWSHA
jgi:hypothetical protein